jgi:hypothetical protein
MYLLNPFVVYALNLYRFLDFDGVHRRYSCVLL